MKKETGGSQVIHNDVISEYKEYQGRIDSVVFEIESFSLVRSGISRGSPTIAVMDIGSSGSKDGRS